MPLALPPQNEANESADQSVKKTEAEAPIQETKNIMGAINDFLAKFSSIPISKKVS